MTIRKVSEVSSGSCNGILNGILSGIFNGIFNGRELEGMLATSHEGTGVGLHNHPRVHFRYLSFFTVNDWEGYRRSTDNPVTTFIA